MEIIYVLLLLSFNIFIFFAPIILAIEGVVQLKKAPAKAKKSIISAGILMLIGLGICGGLG